MSVKLIPIIIGCLLAIGGIWTIIASRNYVSVLKSKGTENVWSPFSVFYGYFIGIIFTIFGIAMAFGWL